MSNPSALTARTRAARTRARAALNRTYASCRAADAVCAQDAASDPHLCDVAKDVIFARRAAAALAAAAAAYAAAHAAYAAAHADEYIGAHAEIARRVGDDADDDADYEDDDFYDDDGDVIIRGLRNEAIDLEVQAAVMRLFDDDARYQRTLSAQPKKQSSHE